MRLIALIRVLGNSQTSIRCPSVGLVFNWSTGSIEKEIDFVVKLLAERKHEFYSAAIPCGLQSSNQMTIYQEICNSISWKLATAWEMN